MLLIMIAYVPLLPTQKGCSGGTGELADAGKFQFKLVRRVYLTCPELGYVVSNPSEVK